MIKPGTKCVIVSEDPGCERNIGATLRVSFKSGTAWEFTEQSRPLVMRDIHSGRMQIYYPDDVNDIWAVIDEKHLVPFEDLGAKRNTFGDEAMPIEEGILV